MEQIPRCSMFTYNRITMRKYGYAKTRIVDFPRRNSHIFGGKFYFKANFSQWEILLWKYQASSEGRGGKGWEGVGE